MATTSAGGAILGEATGGVFLDPEIFARLKASRDPKQCADAWLDTVSRIIDKMDMGVVVLGPPGRGPFSPVATWPQDAHASRELTDVTESAVRIGKLVVESGKRTRDDGTTGVAIGYPLIINDQICGAAAIEITEQPDSDIRLAMDQLEWACGWLENLVRRRRGTSSDRLQTVIELLATSLHHDRFQAAATAAATELAGALGCERVSIGFVRGRHIRMRAMSHSASFAKKANVTRAIEAAMDEALDQQAVIVYPPTEDGPQQVTRAHAGLMRDHGVGPICTVPLAEGQRLLGAITLERPVGEAFEPDVVRLCENAAALLGPVLEIKRKDDRWLVKKIVDSARIQLRKLVGPRHVGFKLSAIVAVFVILFLSFAREDYRITADATLEGAIQRAVAAPIAGYLVESNVRAGDIIKANQVIALLDDRDLRLEKLKWISQRSKQRREYSEAIARNRRAQTLILKTQIEQSQAQIALIEEQLKRTRIVAPFDGYVVAGDLSQSLGAPVERGDILFEVAPLHAYRVILQVDERDIGSILVGQEGRLVLASAPDESLTIIVRKITPVSSSEEGRTFFRVESEPVGEVSEKLRPGMEGVGKIFVDRRRLVWVWSYKIIHWVRMFVWYWWP